MKSMCLPFSTVKLSECRLSCDMCGDGVPRSAVDRERHAFEVHGLGRETHCPWCRTRLFAEDAGRMSHENVKHVARCLELTVWERVARRCGRRPPFRCCGLELGVRGFDAHVRDEHGLPLDDDCVWCRGRRTTRRHRRECFGGRPELHVVVEDPEESSCSVCRVFDASERRRLMGGRPPPPGPEEGGLLYRSFGGIDFLSQEWFSRPDDGRTVRFDERCGLGSDAPFFVRRFVDLTAETAGSDVVSWFHFFVGVDAFSGFVDAFRTLFGSSVGLLPFWCLCDGGGTVHRHGIAVARTAAAFRHAYRRGVRFDDGGGDRRCKGYRRIRTAQDLVNAICYVGGERSRCRFDVPRHDDPLGETEGPVCHYHLNRPVSPHARMYLSMTVPGGLADYLRWRNGKVDVHDMQSFFYDRRRRAFFVSVRELFDREPRGCPIPLADDLEEISELLRRRARASSEELWSLDDAAPVRLGRFDHRLRTGRRTPFVERLADSDFVISVRLAGHLRETQLYLARDDDPNCDRALWSQNREVEVLRSRVSVLEAEMRTLRDRLDARLLGRDAVCPSKRSRLN